MMAFHQETRLEDCCYGRTSEATVILDTTLRDLVIPASQEAITDLQKLALPIRSCPASPGFPLLQRRGEMTQPDRCRL